MPLEPDKQAQTNNPVILALRSQMKGRFLREFAAIDQTLSDQALLVVYGSTLMRQLILERGITFALPGIKSSDIDIGVIADGLEEKEFTRLVRRKVAPIVREAVVKTGFDYLSAPSEPGRPRRQERKTSAQVAEEMDSDLFGGEFMVTKTFSPQEMHAFLKSASDYDELKGLIPDKPLEVLLSIGVNDRPFPSLMTPYDATPEGGVGHYKRARASDMLAGKLARCMRHTYKPTDLIDIYNLIKGYYPDGRPLLDLDPASPNNVLDVARVLILTHLHMGHGIWPEKTDLLHMLDNNDENKRRFLAALEREISSIKMPVLARHVDDIFTEINNFLRKVKDLGAKRAGEERGVGPLELSKNEWEFYAGIEGFQDKVTITTPERPPVKLLGITFLSRKPAQIASKREPRQPVVNVEILKKEHPGAFRKYPELERNIPNNPIIRAKVAGPDIIEMLE